MLHLRLIFGTLLALAVIGVTVLDGAVSAMPGPGWRCFGVSLDHWLLNGALSTLLVLCLAALAVREMLRLARHLGYTPLRFEAYVFAGGLVIGPYVSFNVARSGALYDESWGMLWLALALAVAFLAQAVRRGTERVMGNLATTLLIIVYAGGLLGFMTKLRMEVSGPAGAALLLFSMFIIKMTDVGAYFAGLAFGRHRAVPWLSPKKTWEGFAGGIVTAVLCAVFVGGALAPAEWLSAHRGALAAPGAMFAFGLVMAAFSIAGDLAESLLKRDAAMKDSGTAIPGMGGFLDVLDSAMLAAPAAWFFWTRISPLL